MSTILTQLAEAIQLHRAGQLAEAEAIYRHILAIDPNLADAWHLLGLIAHQCGANDAALECIGRAIALKPDEPTFLGNLGSVLNTLDRNDEAIRCFEQSFAIDANQPKAWYNYGNTLRAMGRADEAMSAYRRAIELQPLYAEAHTNLGVMLRERDRIEEAIMHYRAAVAARPDFAPGLFNLGNALQALSVTSPVETLSLYQEAVRLQPNYYEAHTNLGVVLKEVGRLDEAVRAYQAALVAKPDFVEASSNLSVAYQDLGLLGDARATLERAMALKPDFTEIHSNYVFIANYMPDMTPAMLRELHIRWTNSQTSRIVRRNVEPRDRDPARRLRIGLVSPDLRMHPVGRFIAAWFEHHRREQFETYVYADIEREDHWTEWLRQRAAVWRNVRKQSHEVVADQIVADEIDILIDLAGHTSHNRLPVFAARPAPVQISYLGYPNTTGLDAIDYLITDAIADPPGYESHYSEQLLRLEPCFSCFFPPEVSPDVNELPAGESGPITFGGLHNLAKLNDGVLDLWAELLRTVPNSRLLLVRDALCGTVKARLHEAFVTRGVEAARLDFRHELPGGLHLPLYQQIDMALDTFPWSGHTTACEALWMGVPVVTLATDRHAGRMVASVLHAVGRDEWTATSRREYIDIAARLASDRTKLANIRRGLRPAMLQSPLCDTAGFARQLETVLRGVWNGKVSK